LRTTTGLADHACHSLKECDDTDYIKWLGTIPVVCRSLATLSRQGVVPSNVGILKIDTERCDLEVLQGMGEMTAAVIMVEYWDGIPHFAGPSAYRIQDVVDLLAPRGFHDFLVYCRRWGFEVARIGDARTQSGEWGNVIFIHESVRADLLPVAFEAVASSRSALIQQVEQLLSSMDEKESVIAELASVAQERQYLIDVMAVDGKRMAAELERDGSLIAELVSTSEQQQGRIRMLESELMQKESTISELAEAARDRLVLIDELTANNESAQAQLAPAAELQNRIVKLEQELVEKEATITELAAAAHDRLSVINQLEVTLAQLRRAP
jgi:hypothetical protein